MCDKTQIYVVRAGYVGRIKSVGDSNINLENWDIEWDRESPDYANLSRAAKELRTTDIPVAFPTETVYGLAADATRSSAVNGIYKAKNRPADNPLIVHFDSLNQLRDILQENSKSAIPSIYDPLVRRFWPGPLTILLPVPKNSKLAPEVTAGLDTFGARIPRNLLALALIKLVGVPLAAPSANSSTKPSPTTAEHVLEDLNSRITTILDGGPCSVGVESTVVNGLTNPPSILRPGGVTVQQLRECPGWEKVTIEYKDTPDPTLKPKAPGMKYRHYSPRAPVILFEYTCSIPPIDELVREFKSPTSSIRRIGIIRTTARGSHGHSINEEPLLQQYNEITTRTTPKETINSLKPDRLEEEIDQASFLARILTDNGDDKQLNVQEFEAEDAHCLPIKIWEIRLGPTIESVARGLFSALRYLDGNEVNHIFVEGIDASESGLADAIMNRLRKAANSCIT